MHELAICQSLIDQLETIARERDAVLVTSVIVGIGPLSGVEARLLKNAYPVASAGTVAENAELVIESLPVRVKCPSCNSESEVPPNKLVCKQCGDWRTTLVSGDELMLMSVELETMKSEKRKMKNEKAESASTEVRH
jgi:hydrogenase nickel incorporation protein HypA/HybF